MMFSAFATAASFAIASLAGGPTAVETQHKVLTATAHFSGSAVAFPEGSELKYRVTGKLKLVCETSDTKATARFEHGSQFAHTAEVSCAAGKNVLDVNVTGKLLANRKLDVRLGVWNVKTSWGGEKTYVLGM
ncbi:hypothetical protein GCM10022247_48140 [Allokutzneria multivorans]|uniref:Uncharacterized protein n=1 Tax=Allokutzneria multivorans TaxID=1142134 RepID=A0ABP7SZL2_9PSEU